MNGEKQKSLDMLAKRQPAISWELALLIVLVMTVLGVATRSQVKSFPHHDPYDLRADRAVADSRNRVETGL